MHKIPCLAQVARMALLCTPRRCCRSQSETNQRDVRVQTSARDKRCALAANPIVARDEQRLTRGWHADRLLDLGDVVKRSRVRFQKKNLEVDLTSTKTNRAYLELQPNFCPQPSQPRNMDRQAIFGDTLPVGGISSTSPYLFDLFDDGQPEYIDYSSYAPTIDPASLHFEPSALTVFQDQPGIHLNQGTCGVPDLFDLLRDDQSPITVEDRYSIPGTMSGYDSTIPHAPPSSLSWTPGQYSEALSSCPSLEIHQNRADSPLSTNFFDATGQHTGVTEEIRKPREILPCPAERKLRGEEMSCPLTDMNGKSPRKKNRPCDLTYVLFQRL